MQDRIHLDILPQPDDTTCGPTCLHSLYRYYEDEIPLDRVIDEVHMLDSGGTLAVFLAIHALRRNYDACIYTYNLNVFDPTWFKPNGPDLAQRLIAQAHAKNRRKINIATEAYLEFLRLGGELRFQDLTPRLVRQHLKRREPIITGLSSTFLYRAMREVGHDNTEDDARGTPAGHFVVLCGYIREERTVLVADPFLPNPYSHSQYYLVGIDRVLCSILLGVLTHDANLLVIKPKRRASQKRHDADTDHR